MGPGGAAEKMDRMKIIKRRLSMSLRSARPVDDSLSELAEQMALDEPSAARDNGEIHQQEHSHTGIHKHLSRCYDTGLQYAFGDLFQTLQLKHKLKKYFLCVILLTSYTVYLYTACKYSISVHNSRNRR